MKKVFIIDGGAGRVISASSSLERYIKENPQEDVSILIHGWDTLFWSNPLLQDRTFNINDKSVFSNIVKNADVIVQPEPYILPEYIRQEFSLAQAFNYLINGRVENPQDCVPSLQISDQERFAARKTILDIKQKHGDKKTIVFQPFGQSAHFEMLGEEPHIVDTSKRSMNLFMYSSMIKKLSEKYNVILFAHSEFHFSDDQYSIKMNGDLRTYMSLISECDYFIGVDSVGQHMARSFEIPGTVIFGSTFPENVSYPDWFHVVDKDETNRVYSPIRFNQITSHLADRLNDGCMNYQTEDIKNICEDIDRLI